MKKTESWSEVCNLEDIPQKGARVLKTHQGDIAIFRTSDNSLYALHDKCPHKDGPLSLGIVHDKRVTCPMHAQQIELATGIMVPPDEGQTGCIAVKLEGDRVMLALGR